MTGFFFFTLGFVFFIWACWNLAGYLTAKLTKAIPVQHTDLSKRVLQVLGKKAHNELSSMAKQLERFYDPPKK